MNRALLVIDVQNDYFPGGAYPLWNAELALANILKAIGLAREKAVPIVLVQHIVSGGGSLFFNEGTPGAEIRAEILASAAGAKVVQKHFADGFHRTDLGNTLAGLQAETLLVCGMMTQNCVTHTAISRGAEKYLVKVLPECCATIREDIHIMALDALSARITVESAEKALA